MQVDEKPVIKTSPGLVVPQNVKRIEKRKRKSDTNKSVLYKNSNNEKTTELKTGTMKNT